MRTPREQEEAIKRNHELAHRFKDDPELSAHYRDVAEELSNEVCDPELYCQDCGAVKGTCNCGNPYWNEPDDY